MTTFYSNNISEREISLDENDSRHAIKSLRLKINDSVNVVSGKGELFKTKISDANPKKTILTVSSKEQFKAENPLILAFSPTKNNDRNEWVIEKAIEIGITTCIPVFTQNSERRKWNSIRMNKIAIAAMKQSGRYWLPKICEPIKFNDFITSMQIKNKFIAHCKNGDKKALSLLANSKEPQLILIGPEGDFTNEEIKLAESNMFIETSLGSNRLRTETACIAALSILKLSY